MKVETVKRYVCDLCGAAYDTEQECLRCEKFHKTRFRISNFQYNSQIWDASGGLPTAVEFEYDEGEAARKILYIRDPNWRWDNLRI